MRVEIWSDVICPWCYIGKRRFEAALGTPGMPQALDISWRPFELNPDMPAEGMSRDDYVRAKFGGGRSTGFALIYDNHDLLKKYDSKKQLRKVSRLLISSFLSVCFASDFITNYLGRHRNQTQGRTQSPQGTQDQSRQGQGHQEGLRLDRQEEEVSAPVG